jgi:hypothetical protein
MSGSVLLKDHSLRKILDVEFLKGHGFPAVP